MTAQRTVSTTVRGEPCRVTSPLHRSDDPPVYVLAADATITAAKADGRQWWLAVKCDRRDQADYVTVQMGHRDDLECIHALPRGEDMPEADEIDAYAVIPFRLLNRRWLADWRETADRIEVREGASGSVYMTAVIDGQTVAEKRVPAAHLCEGRATALSEVARLRAQHPSLWLFDFRPVKGEG